MNEYNAQICNLAAKSNHSDICNNTLLLKKFLLDDEIQRMSLLYEPPR